MMYFFNLNPWPYPIPPIYPSDVKRAIRRFRSIALNPNEIRVLGDSVSFRELSPWTQHVGGKRWELKLGTRWMPKFKIQKGDQKNEVILLIWFKFYGARKSRNHLVVGHLIVEDWAKGEGTLGIFDSCPTKLERSFKSCCQKNLPGALKRKLGLKIISTSYFLMSSRPPDSCGIDSLIVTQEILGGRIEAIKKASKSKQVVWWSDEVVRAFLISNVKIFGPKS